MSDNSIQGPEDSPHQVLEDTGVGFDPAAQHLDLTKDEKRRVTALLMATQAYKDLIIREADYLREAAHLAQSGQGPTLKPATIDAMIDAAIKFDCFIACGGALVGAEEGRVQAGAQGETSGKARKKDRDKAK